VSSEPEDFWASVAMNDHIWRHTDPEEMIEVVIDVVNQLHGNGLALGYVGAGPLEDLLGGHDAVMRRAADEALTNADFRSALAVVYGVRYRDPGYEHLHHLVRAEIGKLGLPTGQGNADRPH
jgi:hypothetical protein